MYNDGNKKRSGLETERLSTAKHLQKVIPFQIAPTRFVFYCVLHAVFIFNIIPICVKNDVFLM